MLPAPCGRKASFERQMTRLVLLLLLCTAFPVTVDVSESERFKNTEIRVIRPRYFTKAGRLEVSGGATAILNESFIYGGMLTGLAAYHFSEDWAVEFGGSYGLSIDTSDKRILFDEFDIKTQIFRTSMMLDASLQWTPIYGKWQLGSGRLIYFDTYVSAGYGQSFIDWRYDDFCEPPDPAVDPNAEAVPDNIVKPYPAFLLGMGQRFFLSRNVASKIDVRFRRLMYNEIDGECSPIKAQTERSFGVQPHDTITLFLGLSYYF